MVVDKVIICGVVAGNFLISNPQLNLTVYIRTIIVALHPAKDFDFRESTS